MPKTPATEEIVPEPYRKLLKQLMADAHELLLAGKELPARIYLGSTQAELLQAVPVDTSSPDSKAESAQHARRVATFIDADFMVMVMEGWGLPADKINEHQAIVAKYGSVSRYPKRLDVVGFQLETRHGFFNATAPILPVPPSKKRRKMGAVAWVEADHAKGTFADILVHLPKPRPSTGADDGTKAA